MSIGLLLFYYFIIIIILFRANFLFFRSWIVAYLWRVPSKHGVKMDTSVAEKSVRFC